MHNCLELTSSALNFFGGFVLAIDAFTIKQRIRIESTQRELLRLAKEKGVDLEAPGGRPLNAEIDLLLFLSNRSLNWTRLGFGLISSGFLLDVIAKLR